jgi:hypothetical protein
VAGSPYRRCEPDHYSTGGRRTEPPALEPRIRRVCSFRCRSTPDSTCSFFSVRILAVLDCPFYSHPAALRTTSFFIAPFSMLLPRVFMTSRRPAGSARHGGGAVGSREACRAANRREGSSQPMGRRPVWIRWSMRDSQGDPPLRLRITLQVSAEGGPLLVSGRPVGPAGQLSPPDRREKSRESPLRRAVDGRTTGGP